MPLIVLLSLDCLGPSINRLVTDKNTKLCCWVFVLARFQSTTAYKIDSEHTRDYTKLFPVCKVAILQVTVNKNEVLLRIFCPSVGAEFQPHSQMKIATFFPNTMSDFPK